MRCQRLSVNIIYHADAQPHSVYLNRAMYGKLESLQGTIVKAFLGLSRYSHHSKLLTALDILPIEESISPARLG